MRYFVVFCLVVCSLLVSGCVPDFNYGNGIVVDSSFDPSLVETGQPTNYMLKFQNQGQFTAENVYLYVYGLRDEWKQESGDERSGGIYVGDVEAPLIEDNRVIADGETKYYDWMFSSPLDVKSSDVRRNTMRARVCYGYKSIAMAKIKLVSSYEWNSRSKQEKIDLTVSKGPLDIKVESMQPVVVLSDRKGFSVLKVSIDNVGGGNFVAYGHEKCKGLSSISEDDLNVIDYVSVRLDGKENICDFDQDIYLRKGDSQVFIITCENLDLDGSPEREINLEIELGYNYYLDSTADVEVRGVDR